MIMVAEAPELTFTHALVGGEMVTEPVMLWPGALAAGFVSAS
jgi:hypothetical protein